MDQFVDPETDANRQFLDPETDKNFQFLDKNLLDPETDVMEQFLGPETDIKHQFLDPETDIKRQFLVDHPETDIMDQFLDPETDIMGERTYIPISAKAYYNQMAHLIFFGPHFFTFHVSHQNCHSTQNFCYPQILIQQF